MSSKFSHLVLFVCFLFFHESAADKNCTNFLIKLARLQGGFVNCMVSNSNPAESCLKCFTEYTDLTNEYNQLDANCSKQIIDKNRFNIVYDTQKYLVNVWNKGFCYDCFDGCVESNETSLFHKLLKNFEDCISEKRNNVCQKCAPSYFDLNNFYKKMDETKKGKVCFDNQDAMNRTRSQWSKDLNCCHREYSFSWFFIACSFFTALPIVFYFGMFGHAKYLERNHEVLDADLNNERPSTSTTARLQSGRVSNIDERPTRLESNSSNFEDVDMLKSQLKNRLKDRSTEEPVKNVLSEEPHSSNAVQSLIEL